MGGVSVSQQLRHIRKRVRTPDYATPFKIVRCMYLEDRHKLLHVYWTGATLIHIFIFKLKVLVTVAHKAALPDEN